MNRGYVLLPRLISETGLFHHHSTLALLTWMTLKATHKPIQKLICGKHITLQPGQLVFSRSIAAKDLDVSEKVVRTAKRVLEEGRYVASTRAGRFTVISILVWDTWQNPKNYEGQHKGRDGADLGAGTGPDEGRDGATLQEVKEDKKEKKKNTPSLFEGEFDSFWTAYPRKVSKEDAKKAWAKQKPPLADVLAALEWQRQTTQWTKNDGDSIPYPATYLNGKRWEDEPPKSAPSPAPIGSEYIGGYKVLKPPSQEKTQ